MCIRDSYRLASDAGEWTVLSANDGRDALKIGQTAALDWPDHCARLLPAETAEKVAA